VIEGKEIEKQQNFRIIAGNRRSSMNEEIELGALSLTDKSDLVLTAVHVFQHQDRGIFGESRAIIPRKAITTVRISWQRSRGLLVLGAILLATFLVFVISSIFAGPAGMAPWEQVLNLSSSAVSLIQYASLLGAIGIFVLFWFYKRNEIQIVALTGTLGGTPRSYEEAKKFCFLLASESRDQQATAKKSENAAASSPATADHDWQL
jgi:hypothetical protein